jgi:hypothetical protein
MPPRSAAAASQSSVARTSESGQEMEPAVHAGRLFVLGQPPPAVRGAPNRASRTVQGRKRHSQARPDRSLRTGPAACRWSPAPRGSALPIVAG